MQNNTESQVYAGFFVRLSAYLIDWVIVGAALLIIRIPIWIVSFTGAMDFMFQDFIFRYSVYDIVLYLLKTAYFVLLTYYTGSTLGKKLLQIRVVSTEDRKPTFFEIVFRESVGKFLSALIVYVGYIMIGADRAKRGLHDILSDTYVVYYHQKTVAVPAPITYNTVRYTVANTQMPPYQAGAAGRGQYTSQNMPEGPGFAAPWGNRPQGSDATPPGNGSQGFGSAAPWGNRSQRPDAVSPGNSLKESGMAVPTWSTPGESGTAAPSHGVSQENDSMEQRQSVSRDLQKAEENVSEKDQ